MYWYSKNTNIGGNINVGGNSIIQGTQESHNIQSGSLILSGGIGIIKNTNIAVILILVEILI